MLPRVTTVADLATPALVVDTTALARNLDTMSAALPGARLRPHVKAHKCTALAKLQARAGHKNFTCATIREVEGMAAAGLGDDLLLANFGVSLVHSSGGVVRGHHDHNFLISIHQQR